MLVRTEPRVCIQFMYLHIKPGSTYPAFVTYCHADSSTFVILTLLHIVILTPVRIVSV